MLFSEWKKQYLKEKKDHIIKKIPSLTDEQKQEVIQFFKKYNTLENKIDWNNWQDLTYEDFKKVMSMDTKTQRRKRVKKQGIEGLREGKDYVDFGMFEGYRALAPLTYEASKLIASKYVGGVEGEWCTAWQRTDEHWFNYTDSDVVLVYFVQDGDKIALAYNYPDKKEFTVYDKKDREYDDYFEPPIDVEEFIEDNEDKLDSLSEKILDSEEKEYRQTRKDFLKAVKNNDVKKVKECIEKGINPSINDNWAIQMASRYGHTEIVKLLLQDERVDPSADDNYAIRWASHNGHIEIIKLLLQDVDPSADDNYAIRLASKYGHTEIVKLLLQDDRVDPSDDNNEAIQWASLNGHTEIIKLLLQDERVDPSAVNNLPIRWASEKGHTKVVKLLLQDDRVKNSLSDEELQKYKEEAGLKEYNHKIKRNLKYLKETPEAEDIILNTLEMFSATDDFKTSAFLTPDGEYVGKGRGKKIASTVLRRLNIKTDSPLTDFMNSTKTVNIEYKNGNVFVYIPKNLSIYDTQVNDITNIFNHISKDLYVNIIENDKIIEKKKFKIYEINKLKSYLRSLR